MGPNQDRLARLSTALALAGLVLLVGPVAWAGAYFIPDRGARALSRGGAFTAGADNLNAAWFNPALIGRGGQGALAYVDLGVIHQSIRFERTLDVETAAIYPRCCEAVENEAAPVVDPSFMVGYAPEGEAWAVALSLYGLYGALPKYPEDGPQRYSLVSLDSRLIHYQLTLAYEVTPEIRVGVGAQLRSFLLKQRSVVSAYPGFIGAAEDKDLDTLIELDVAHKWHPGFVVGAWWAPVAGLEFGASFQAPFQVEAEGDLSARIASHYMFATTAFEGSDVLVETNLPAMARFGVRYTGGAWWDVEANFVWEGWSVHEDVVITPQEAIKFTNVAGVGDYHVRKFVVREEFQDTISMRLGGTVAAMDGVNVSTGGFFETAAVPDRTLTVSLVDSERFGLAAGVSIEAMDGLSIDIAYAHLFMPDREITTSERRQVSTLYPEGSELRAEGRTLVGNGSYESSYDALAIGFSGAF